MLALVASLVLAPVQFGFDWDMSGEDGPLSDFSMTAKFQSRSEPFQGPVPENPDITVPMGGRVFARINVVFEVQEHGEPTEVWSSTCGNICQGPPPNHASHADCDRFCNRLCEATHKFEGEAHEGFSGWALERLQRPFTDAFVEAARLFRNRSMSVDANMDWLTHIRDDFIGRANEKSEKEVFTFQPQHVGRDPFQPCLSAKFSVFKRRERVVATIQKDLVFQERRGSEYATVAEVPMGDDVTVPVADGYETVSGTITESGVRCLCGDHSSALWQEQPAVCLGMNWRSFPNSGSRTTFASLIKDMSWRNVQLEVLGENMNVCSVDLKGDPMAQAFIPAGTVLVPDNALEQIMLMMEDYSSEIAAGPGEPAAKKVRVACAEMNKKEPTSKTRFAVKAGSDGNLRRLAKITAASRFRGPWDQVRIWIYTDAATYEEMEKRLMPMIAKPTYLMELDRVLDGGLDPAKRKKLLQAISLDMIADFRCGESGLSRALPVLWKKDSKKLLSAAPGYAAAWIKESPANAGPEMVATLAYFLGLKKQPEARAAARAILAAVPEASRAKVAERGGLEAVGSGVFSKDRAEIQATVDLLKSYGAEMYAKTVEFGEGRLKQGHF